MESRWDCGVEIPSFLTCTYTVPLPFGRPRAFTTGLLGVEGVEGVAGNTEERKLDAGDGGTEENGDDISE